MKQTRNFSDMVVALVVVLFGLGMLALSWGYPRGTPGDMGPGWFPMAVAVVIVLLGIVLFFATDSGDTETPRGSFALRELIFICLGILAFAILLEPAGLVPAVFVLIALSAFAQRPVPIVGTLVNAIVTSALCYLIFVLGLGLPIAAFALG